MFKSKLIIILLCLCVVAGIANAQEKKPQVIQSEPQLEDIYNVLEAMDIHMFRFELKEFLNKVYTVTVYMDEYENGKSPKQVHNIRLGNVQRRTNRKATVAFYTKRERFPPAAYQTIFQSAFPLFCCSFISANLLLLYLFFGQM